MPLAPDDLYLSHLKGVRERGGVADAFEIVLADGRKMGMKVRRWDRMTG